MGDLGRGPRSGGRARARRLGDAPSTPSHPDVAPDATRVGGPPGPGDVPDWAAEGQTRWSSARTGWSGGEGWRATRTPAPLDRSRRLTRATSVGEDIRWPGLGTCSDTHHGCAWPQWDATDSAFSMSSSRPRSTRPEGRRTGRGCSPWGPGPTTADRSRPAHYGSSPRTKRGQFAKGTAMTGNGPVPFGGAALGLGSVTVPPLAAHRPGRVLTRRGPRHETRSLPHSPTDG